ncbi:uncharacterized protein LOC112051976 [Bicyclus anynana]|uniref:Uncharacterized protein LOC112051976 n=1 Tax=Bicyclus anynana TaxID=110368 RepID=A0A6J1NNL0_BICAN|nr:uncharacterized protein LOC112051976 [Bicyclus anynana]XP_052737798.1 uncharacterized protein LOC112051976 [Bicyclus anynana]XP_052737800.1 uncharacterized protein LOC112051976 [Bicyclus anynana]
MGAIDENNALFKEEMSESTAEPGVSMIAEEVPSLTVATILGVTVVIVITIIVVFVLGVLIDWRQQRLMDKRIGEVKRMKIHKKKTTAANLDVVSIADNMEEPGMSTAPAEFIKNLP